MKKLKVMTVVGTRPEIIRLSCVLQKLDQSEAIDHTLVHTGQNYDYELNEVFFEDLGLRKPDYFLNAAGKNATEFQRSKETADDYRYMPEPDIPVIEVTDTDIERIKGELVELPHEKIVRYMNDWDISQYAAEVISATRDGATYFEKLQILLSEKLEEKIAAQEAANWLMGTVYALANQKGIGINEVDIKDLSLLITKFKEGKITKGKAEEILKDCITNGKDISDTLEAFEQEASVNAGNIQDIVKQIIDNNPKAVADYKGGKEATMGFLVGQVMQVTKGSVNPNEARNILIGLLK